MSTLSWILLILLVASIVTAAIVCKSLKKEINDIKSLIVTVSDKKPKTVKKDTDYVLQLSNELVPYLDITDDAVSVTVLKKEEK